MRRFIRVILVAVLVVSVGSCRSGKMYYTVTGKTITIHNTPNGTMQAELEMAPGASSAKQTLYIVDSSGNIGKDTIEIEYDPTGVKSVTMKGVAIPRQ